MSGKTLDEHIVTPPPPTTIPAPPLGFTVTTSTPTTATLNWIASSGATSYEIHYKASGASAPWTVWKGDGTIIGGVSTSATITGLRAGTDYQFQIRAINSIGQSAWAITQAKTQPAASATAPVPPTWPIVVKTGDKAPTHDSVTVTWGATAGTTYVLTYKIPSGIKGIAGTTISEVVVASSSGVFAHTINKLKQGTNYKITIVAQYANTGAAAKAVVIAAKTLKYHAVKGVKASTPPTISSIALTWSASTLSMTNGYVIEVWSPKTKSEPAKIVQTLFVSKTEETTKEIRNLKASTKYTFKVIAITGNSAENRCTESAVASKTISTARYAAVTAVKTAKDTVGNVVLEWKIPNNTAGGAQYEHYKIFWQESNGNEIEISPILITIADNKRGATIDGSVLTTALPSLNVTAKNTFIIRAITNVTLDDGTIAVSSLDSKVSFVPSTMKAT
jgi:hypothetical protein